MDDHSPRMETSGFNVFVQKENSGETNRAVMIIAGIAIPPVIVVNVSLSITIRDALLQDLCCLCLCRVCVASPGLTLAKCRTNRI